MPVPPVVGDPKCVARAATHAAHPSHPCLARGGGRNVSDGPQLRRQCRCSAIECSRLLAGRGAPRSARLADIAAAIPLRVSLLLAERWGGWCCQERHVSAPDGEVGLARHSGQLHDQDVRVGGVPAGAHFDQRSSAKRGLDGQPGGQQRSPLLRSRARAPLQHLQPAGARATQRGKSAGCIICDAVRRVRRLRSLAAELAPRKSTRAALAKRVRVNCPNPTSSKAECRRRAGPCHNATREFIQRAGAPGARRRRQSCASHHHDGSRGHLSASPWDNC